MSLVTQLQSLATRIATEAKALRTLINGNAADLSALTTTNKTNLVAAINEVRSGAGSGATNLDGLSDVIITTPVSGHVLRHNGTTGFVNVLGTTYYDAAGAAAAAQAASQPLAANLTALAGAPSSAYGRSVLAATDAADLRNYVGTATELLTGVVELATTAEAAAGVDTARAVTPAGVAAAIAALVASAPAALNTLNELATALGNDANFATSMTTALAGKQALDATLTAFAGLVTAADRLPYATGVDTFGLTTFTAFARTLLDDADAATARGTLAVYGTTEIGDPATNFVTGFEAGLV